MAGIQVDVNDADVITVLKQNHNFSDGDAIKQATEVSFDPRYSNSGSDHVVSVTLKFALTSGEVDRLLGR